MIGGALEGNAFRDFAHKQLGVPEPILEQGRYPPQSATIIDRGVTQDGAVKSRGFANLPGMIRILEKYNISYDVVTDAEASDWHESTHELYFFIVRPRFSVGAQEFF